MTTTTRQGADLTAHLTYFDPSTQASFVWDGRSPYIEVSIGGYSEPVDHVIVRPGDLTSPDFIADTLNRFAEVADRHAATLDGHR